MNAGAGGLPELPEAVAHQYLSCGWHGITDQFYIDKARRLVAEGAMKLDHYRELYTADQMRAYATRALAGGVPEGWKLVPVEPTEAMQKVGRNRYEESSDEAVTAKQELELFRCVWAAMLAAAPGPGDGEAG